MIMGNIGPPLLSWIVVLGPGGRDPAASCIQPRCRPQSLFDRGPVPFAVDGVPSATVRPASGALDRTIWRTVSSTGRRTGGSHGSHLQKL